MDYHSGLKTAESKGKAEMAQEAISKYLEARFGEAALDLQQKVRECTDLEQLDRIINNIYTAATLAEARAIIAGIPEKRHGK